MKYADGTGKRVSYFLITLMLSACANQGVAPVVSRQAETTSEKKKSTQTSSVKKQVKQPEPVRNSQGFHIVSKGDTLYSIAWDYGHYFRDVAVWNQINDPYLIYPGQVIRLKPDTGKKRAAVVQPGPVVNEDAKPTTTVNVPKPVVSEPKKTETAKPVVSNNNQKRNMAVGQTDKEISWRWPVKGKIIKSRSLTSKKGVDIAGRLGQDVKAAAQGDVVYSGSGLLGYGRLIIIKHNETFLSAYAHNQELLVKEGEAVGAGQIIAKMGTNNNGQPQLHFEIRKNGKSVNPLQLLPKS